MRRDTNQLRQNDTFAVLFDTFHDKRNGYIFYANAIGGLADSQITDEGPPNVDWNTVWEVRTDGLRRRLDHRDGDPLQVAALRSPAREQTWGVNLRRVVRWKNEWSYLAQVPRALTTFRGMLKVSSAGTLTGLQAPSGSTDLEIKPYALGGVSTDRTVSPPLSSDGDDNVGGDVKYGITQNLTADLTINTDFAQVEVDEQQVNLTRFNLFFPEKRDFFLEGARHVRIRRTRQRRPGARAAATRRICSSAAASASTAAARCRCSRRARHRQGRQVHLRRAQRADRRRGRGRVESANFTVLRAKRDILGRSSIGGMFTHRTATPGRVGANEGYGVDAALRFYQNVRVDGYLAATQDRRTRRRQPQLSRLLRLQRRQVRRPGRAPGGASRTSCPRWASCAAPTCAATSACCASARARRTCRTSARLTTQASLNYLTNTQNRLDTREQVGQFRDRVHQQRRRQRHLHRQLRAPGAAVRHRPRRPLPVGAYEFHTTRIGYIGGQQRQLSGEIVYEIGHVLQRRLASRSRSTPRACR